VSGKYRFETPTRMPAQRPPRRRLRAAQPIPSSPDVFAWRPNVEIVVGLPKASRKAQKVGDDV
jgi:hypothetical protein